MTESWSISLWDWKPKEVTGSGQLGGSVVYVSDFVSGHDLRVLGWIPSWGSLLSGVSACPSALPPPCAHSLSLKYIKSTLNTKEKKSLVLTKVEAIHFPRIRRELRMGH